MVRRFGCAARRPEAARQAGQSR